MRSQCVCCEMPSPFQPNPPNSQPRIHSCVIQALAPRNAASKFRHELRKFFGLTKPANQAQNAQCIARYTDNRNGNRHRKALSKSRPSEPSQLKLTVKKTSPVTYPSR